MKQANGRPDRRCQISLQKPSLDDVGAEVPQATGESDGCSQQVASALDPEWRRKGTGFANAICDRPSLQERQHDVLEARGVLSVHKSCQHGLGTAGVQRVDDVHDTRPARGPRWRQWIRRPHRPSPGSRRRPDPADFRVGGTGACPGRMRGTATSCARQIGCILTVGDGCHQPAF